MVQLFVTYLDTIGPHLRIFGQLDRKHMEVVQSNIDTLLTQGEQSSILQVGALCLARRFDKFSRAQILSVEGLDYVTVHFIDYGDQQTLPIQEIRLIKLPKMLEKFPKQVSSYILSGIFCDWKPYHIQEISQDICNVMVEMHVEMEICDMIFVRISFGRQDLAEYLIKHRGIGIPIGLEKLRETFCHIMESSLKMKPPSLYNNNSIKENSRAIAPVRGLHTETSILPNVGYYPVQAMMAPPPVIQPRPPPVTSRKEIHGIANLQTFNPTVLGMQNRNYRMPYQGPEITKATMGQPQQKEIEITPKRSVATFKSNTLMVGMFYDVYCCFVENGPCSFSVHLKSCEDDLNSMMSELEISPLKNLNERPSLGMACIARFSEDGQLYRAVIMSIKPTSCQVAYVDYGNTEVVAFQDLYEIPSNFLDQKIFAIRFALSGYKDLEPIDDFIKNTFKELVLHRNLRLKVMPLEGPPLVQYCELYEGQVNILEALKAHKHKKLRYAEPETLHANDVVVVCYVESPKKFFVQKVSNIQSFEQMMDDLFLFCKKSRNSLDNLAKGTACAVKFENAWYRAEIIGMNANRVSIRHVDFGNERKVDPNQLCSLTDRLVQFPPQAIQCCLKGFENTETLSESASVQLEMLAESDDGDRRHFKCQIFNIEQNGTALVNLIDESMRPELNLMKKLYKLSMPFNKYIGLEKEGDFENNSGQKAFHSHKESHLAVLNSTSLNDAETGHQQSSSEWDSGNVHQQPTSDWEAGSSGSAETRDMRNSSGNNRPRRQHQDSRSFRENSRDNRRDQSHNSFKGKNIPPRFQKQQNDNRRYKDNKMNNSFERNRNSSSDTSGKFSQTPRNSCSQVEVQQEWSCEVNQFNQTPKNSFDQLESKQDWSCEVPVSKEEYVSSDTSFPKIHIDIPLCEEAIICWWISPHQFYTHLKSRTTEFEKMMREMQTFYKNKDSTSTNLSVGSSVIARYREDNVLYRAKIIACNQSLRKYRVEFVDFGNQSTVGENDIYQVEKRFADKPVMAYLCSFEDVISNFDHTYITSRVEQFIKPGTTITCSFNKKESDLYYVNVEINGKSLKDLLINEGLLSAIDTDMKLEMLSGQQIKGKITSIHDLLNFKIEIEGCNLELLCSYNDIKFVKSNPHLSSDFKNNYEGMSCIMDVLDVTGEKILMLQPHIPLITNESTSAICNYPVIYQSLTIKVSHVQSANKIYVHPLAVEDTLAQLLDDMYNFYDANGNAFDDIQPGNFCAANSSDGNWYRARIIRLTNDSNVEVYYIDYGNTELIDSNDKLKVLEETFYSSSALAVGVCLPLKSINEETVINEIRSLTESYELTLQILERYKNCWIADISSNGYSLINVLEDNSLIQGRDTEYVKNLIDNDISLTDTQPVIFKSKVGEYATSNDERQNEATTTIESAVTTTQEEKTEHMIPAYLSHCDNPGRFFLHSVEDFDELTKLQDNIQIVAGSLPPLMSIVTGAPCIALYSVDDTWYRANIIDNEIMAVQFIDYGNTDVITDSSYIKEMNEAFGNVKPFAIPCSLAIAPKGTVDWIDEANSIFNESYEKTLYFDYITNGEKKNFVNLIIDEKNVAEELVKDGFARKLEILKSGENCFVSHINNLADFYIQMESDADALELIAGHLAGYEDFPIMDNCEEGGICAALFTDDGEWYRAKILSNTSEGVEVLFIDYGNTSIAGEVRQISDEIAGLPFLSKKCSLRMPENILGWSDLAEGKFSELSALGQTVFVVQLIEPGDHAVIDLYIDNKNILEEMEPLCDKRPNITMDSSIISEKEILHSINEPDLRNGTISHINSPADFYVQFTSNSDQLTYITDNLNGKQTLKILEEPKEDCICAAVFPDDDALYRAKILSKTDDGYSVLFIDFGNIAISTDFFELPEELKNIASLATQCTLENPSSNIDLSSDQAYEKFNSILTSFDSEILQIEIINQAVSPWIVRVICQNTNINKELLKSLEDTESSTEKLIMNENGTISEQKDEKENKDEGELTDTVSDLPQELQSDEVIDTPIFEVTAQTEQESQRDCQNIAEKAPLSQPNIPHLEHNLHLESDNMCEEQVESLQENLTKKETVHHSSEVTTDKSHESVLVSHVISPSEFYVQFQNQSLPLKKITDLLEGAEIYEKLTSPEIGSLCVALSPDDGAYYRAKILSTEIDTSEVFLIDYGNKMNTCDLRILPEELQIFQPLAQKCSLFKISGMDYENAKVIAAFNSLMESHFGESFVIERKDDELNNVRLHMQDIEIGAELFKIIKEEPKRVKLCEDLKKVFVSHINSPNDFYVQFSDDSTILDKITENLENANEFEILLNPIEYDICAAKFANDGAFYRARILSVEDNKTEVLFIDFGNTTNSDDLRILPEHLKEIKCIANHCALENLSDINFYTQSATDTFSSLLGSHLNETFQAQIIEKSSDPIVVRLYHHSENLGEKLIKSLEELTSENVTEIWDTVQNTTDDFTSEIIDTLVESAGVIDNIIENFNEGSNGEPADITKKSRYTSLNGGKNMEGLTNEIVEALVSNAEIIDDMIENVNIESSVEQIPATQITENKSGHFSQMEVEQTTSFTNEIVDELVSNTEIIDNVIENYNIESSVEQIHATQITDKNSEHNTKVEGEQTTSCKNEIIEAVDSNAEVIDDMIENVNIKSNVEQLPVSLITEKKSEHNAKIEIEKTTSFADEIVERVVSNAEIIENVNIKSSVEQITENKSDQNAKMEVEQTSFTNEIVDTLVESAKIVENIIESAHISNSEEQIDVPLTTTKELVNHVNKDVNDATADFTNKIVETLVENAEIIDNIIENVSRKSIDQIDVSQEPAKLSDTSIYTNSSDKFKNVDSSHLHSLHDEQPYSSADIGEKLWKRYCDTGMPVSDFYKNRAISTSNIPQSSNSLSSSLLNVNDANTRSKSSDCLHVTAEK